MADNGIDVATIQEDFVAVPASDEDLDGINVLVQQLLKHLPVDTKGLSRLLIEQNYVTTVLKIETDNTLVQHDEPDTVWAVCSAINLKKHARTNAPVKQLIELIVNKSKGKLGSTGSNFFMKLLPTAEEEEETSHKIGLIVKETLTNLPGVAVAPLMAQLFEDLKTAIENGMEYNFTHFVHISKIVKLDDNKIYYVDQIDELIEKKVPASCFFDMDYNNAEHDATVVFQDEEGANIQGLSSRRVFVVAKEQLEDIMKEVNGMDSVRNLLENMQPVR